MNNDLADFISQMLKKYKYANRSEFFRDLVRKEYLKERKVIDNCAIEELHPDDEDFKIIEERKNNSNFQDISSL